jgi:hypothetical protein
MFVNPNTMTVGDLLSTIRDGAFILGLIFGVWKARGAIQPAIDFFKDAKNTMVRGRKHMEIMEEGLAELQTGMAVILTNHLPHMQKDMAKMVRRHGHITDMLALADMPVAEESNPEVIEVAAAEPASEAVVES